MTAVSVRWVGMKTSLEPGACCRVCGSEDIQFNGHTRVGSQQYHCKGCGVWRVLDPKPGTAVEEKRREEILRAVSQERLGLRAAERVFGVTRQTIAGWIKKKPQSCPS